MGHRTLKRVPLDFSYPLNKVWEGYINPYPAKECSDCEGTGYNPSTKQIADDFYDFEGTGRWWCDKITQDEVQALVDAGRLTDFTHTWTREGWKRRADGYIPTADEVNRLSQDLILFGHDTINCFILIETRAKRLGVYGRCLTCNSTGIVFESEEYRKLHDEWQEYEPPIGTGYQLWETVTEGSPISPVFATAEELADWCDENITIFGNEKTSRENWLKMFIGEKDLDTGSLLVMEPGYFGALANKPESK